MVDSKRIATLFVMTMCDDAAECRHPWVDRIFFKSVSMVKKCVCLCLIVIKTVPVPAHIFTYRLMIVKGGLLLCGYGVECVLVSLCVVCYALNRLAHHVCGKLAWRQKRKYVVCPHSGALSMRHTTRHVSRMDRPCVEHHKFKSICD